MDVKVDKLQEWFMYALKKGLPEGIISMGNPGLFPRKINDIIEESIPPNTDLTWSYKFYGPSVLRDEIIETQRYEDMTEDNILITTGANTANFIAALSMLEPGDEVLIERPTWQQIIIICKYLIPAKIKYFDRKEENGWKIDIESLKELISPKTKMIWFVSPNNPTGAVTREKEMKNIVEIAADYGAYILQDECHKGLYWTGGLAPSVTNYYNKGVSTGSISKPLGMVGLRMGWIASKNKEFINKCNIWRAFVTLTSNRLGEILATLALEPDRYQRFLEESKRIGRRNLEFLDRWILKQERITWVKPESSLMGFPKYDYKIDSWEFAEKALKFKLLLAPGIGFDVENHVRMGFGMEKLGELKEGLNRFDHFLKSLE